ncbi:MAG: GGDEF domain-containing protein [Thermoleophilia bacterium]
MGRISALMLLFGVLVGVAFPFVVSGTLHWQARGESVFRVACLMAGLLVGGFAFGVARFTLYQTNRRLARLATLDPLTGLVNQCHFVRVLGTELRRGLYENVPVSLLIADLDHFKEVNDTYGHMAGDGVLVSVAQCIRETLRPHDVACRMGGEEFAVILPGATRDEAAAVADRIRGAVAESMAPGFPSVTVSLGVAAFPDDAATVDLLVKRADDAMYVAKRAGRDAVALWPFSQYVTEHVRSVGAEPMRISAAAL